MSGLNADGLGFTQSIFGNLGSDSNPGLATLDDLLLVPITEPATGDIPSGHKAVFVDTNDSNKLKAKDGAGNITTIVS